MYALRSPIVVGIAALRVSLGRGTMSHNKFWNFPQTEKRVLESCVQHSAVIFDLWSVVCSMPRDSSRCSFSGDCPLNFDDKSSNKASGSKPQRANKLRRLFSTGRALEKKDKAKGRTKQVQSDPKEIKKIHVNPHSRPKRHLAKPLVVRKTPLFVTDDLLDCNAADTTEKMSKEPASSAKGNCGTPKKESSVSDRLSLHEGDCIGSVTKKFVVKRKLGMGGYGAVYHVVLQSADKRTKKHFALKAETHGPGTTNRLKMEVEVLRSIMNAEKSVRTHFVHMIDAGKVPEFAFVVLTLCGPSISSIRDRVLQSDFSHGTAIRIGIESLDAIKDLHTIGYIHRDVKPSNLTIGLGGLFTTIFLIDFGISRRFRNEKGHVRLPRARVKFCGTARFASRATHRSEDQSRGSDLESWFYMLMDLYNQNSLPWKRVKDRDLILALKDDIRTNEGRSCCIVELMPSEFRLLMLYGDSLKYESTPDYDYMRAVLEGTLRRLSGVINEPFDWEKFGPPPCDDD
ncbi:hypothetical protein QR680_016838 [Steinernema hermaphroditum]|uniref:non-specific serine/threonine protein kinase n=1 Tax=Steinernema hermaphroditum TaxID=289476 RepID=A0AA39HEV2_9BILA|nr:hypothetical protein QR680_016838 [Steinernema hermaphroditum]